MNGSLQELVNLCIYEVDGTSMCQVHFKGRQEPYDVVEADELLGDIAELCRQRDEKALSRGLNEDAVDRYCVVNGKRFLSAAVVIAFNNEEEKESETDWDDMYTEEKKEGLLEAVLELLDHLYDNRQTLTLNILEIFAGRFSKYVPVHEIRKKRMNPGCIYGEEVVWVFENAERIAISDTIDVRDNIILYNCDNLAEIIIALIHYLSMRKVPICKCHICERYFIPAKRKDEKYCCKNRMGEDETCKEIGRKQVRKLRLQNDVITKKYNSVYTNLTNKKRTNKYADAIMQSKIENRICELVREFQIRKISMDETALIEWLDSMKSI